MVITEAMSTSGSSGNASTVFPEDTLKHGKFLDEPSLKGSLKIRKQITYALFESDKEKIEEIVEEESSIAAEETLKSGTNTGPTVEIAAAAAATSSPSRPTKAKYEYVWLNIVGMIGLHVAALYGILLMPYAHSATIYWAYICLLLGTLGVQAGAHRLWAHKTYKANLGVRIFLAACQTLAVQNDIWEWSRDHRAHHKFSDTDADPHDSSKGFFFSHVGWLLVKKHPEVIRRGKSLDLSDLEKDPVVVFQRKWYIPLVALCWGAIPTFVPVLLWGEDFIVAGAICVFARYVTSLNLTWFVNSWSHIYGYKKYDTQQGAVESSIRHLLMGEGFHNYHHAFPWDYSASELGAADVFNPATAAIDFFHWMGWAWDLKKVNRSMIEARMKKTGDPAFYHKRNSAFYEWFTGLATMLVPLCLMISYNRAYNGHSQLEQPSGRVTFFSRLISDYIF